MILSLFLIRAMPLAPLRYRDYFNNYRTMITLVTSCMIPTAVVLVCSRAIIRTLRRDLMQTAARDSIVRHTTVMCLAVSFVFIICVAPARVFYVAFPNWPISLHNQYAVLGSLLLLRYTNHAIYFFLYCLMGAHFRGGLVVMFRSWGRSMSALVRTLKTRATRWFHFRKNWEYDLEMH